MSKLYFIYTYIHSFAIVNVVSQLILVLSLLLSSWCIYKIFVLNMFLSNFLLFPLFTPFNKSKLLEVMYMVAAFFVNCCFFLWNHHDNWKPKYWQRGCDTESCKILLFFFNFLFYSYMSKSTKLLKF